MYRVEDNHNNGEDASNQCGNRFKVFGRGTVSAKPDVAEVIIGVMTENVQLEVAQQENARITQQVINSIIQVGVLPQDIQTQNYNIRSEYDFVDGKQIFRGYEVTNNLKIRITNISSVGEIIDTAVKNGANTASGLNFMVSDEARYYYEALSIAISDAQNKARVMASRLQVNLNVIPIQINEQDKGNISPLTTTTFKAASTTTPIEAGENEINANIEAIFSFT